MYTNTSHLGQYLRFRGTDKPAILRELPRG